MLWLLLAGLCAAINCKKLGLDHLDHTFEMRKTENTPPTETFMDVYFNPCSPVGIDGCADDDHFCVITSVHVDGKDFVTNIKSFGSGSNGASERRSSGGRRIGDDASDIFSYEGAKWGERELYGSATISCGAGSNSFDDWGGGADLFIGSGVLCPDTDDEPPSKKPPSKNPSDEDPPSGQPPAGKPKSSGWGFFHWLVFLVLFGAIAYALLTVYVNFAQSRGSIPLAATASDVLRDLPYLIRDVIRKVKASFGTQSRSGYSAL